MADQKPQARAPAVINRACQACRSLKVRCIPEASGTSHTCQRCNKYNRECVFAPQKRKQQRKRTDTRVAELEKEIQAMRVLLGTGHHVSETSTGKATKNVTALNLPPSTSSSVQITAESSASASTVGAMTRPVATAATSTTKPDVIDRGLLLMDTAAELFNVFQTDFSPKYCFLVFPTGYTVDQLRHDKPILFLALMAAASTMSHPELYQMLSTETIQEYARLSLIGGEKSVELVQAMIATVIWHYPVGKFSALKFYEYIHLASTMAIDLGLGEPQPQTMTKAAPVSTEGSFFLGQSMVYDDLDDIESRFKFERQRTLLACYINCVSVSLSSRRPNMLHFTTYMAECINNLESSPHVLSADLQLTAGAKLLNIGEEISSVFELAKGSRPAAILDQDITDRFDMRLDRWLETYKYKVPHFTTKIFYHWIKMMLHERYLHAYYAQDSFRLPYMMEPPRKDLSNVADMHVSDLSKCVTSAQALCELFLSLDMKDIRSSPTGATNRVTQALVILSMTALLDNISADSGSTTTYQEITKAGTLLELCHDKFVEAGGTEFTIPYVLAGQITRLHIWYRYQLHRQTLPSPSEEPPLVLFSDSDDHPALRAAAENTPPFSTAPASTEESPASGEMPKFDFSKTELDEIEFGMDLGDDEWMNGADYLQSFDYDPNLGFETNFYSTGQ